MRDHSSTLCSIISFSADCSLLIGQEVLTSQKDSSLPLGISAFPCAKTSMRARRPCSKATNRIMLQSVKGEDFDEPKKKPSCCL